MVFDKVFDKVRNNTMVKSGLEVYSIAREVYNLVNSNHQANVQKPLNSAEEIFVCAAQKVTEQSEKKIKNRIDYKVVHQGAIAARKVRSVTVGARKVIKKRFNRTKDFIYIQYKNAKTVAIKGYQICKKGLLESSIVSSERMQKLKIQLLEYQQKITNLSRKIYQEVDTFVGFNDVFVYGKKLSTKVKNYAKSIKNKAIVGKNVIVEVASNNIASASKMAVYSYGFAKQMIQADAQAFKTAIDTNRTLLLAYLKNLELEMYYSPDQSFKLIEIIKLYANGLLNKETSNTVPHGSAYLNNGNMNDVTRQIASVQA